MATEHLDVLIVGAGVAGLSAAWHVQARLPGRSFAILEARDALGGTWDLFRYPGIRSDSDTYTFGFAFRPWPHPKAFADGPSILAYLHDTAREAGIDRRIRHGHRVLRAGWSSRDARWTLEVERADGTRQRLSCGFLVACTGYYDHERGHSPAFPGRARFAGPIVHPQHWPAGLDWRGRRVTVIGSGATAVTLVPALAREAAHVTMLQRSPSWMLSLPSEDRVARLLRALLPERTAYALVRRKNVVVPAWFFGLCRRDPARTSRLLIDWARRALPPGFDVDTHFRPRYAPWRQRLCILPDGDLFGAIRAGRASIVTDEVDAFDETGIRLRSGARVDADLIVTATGLELRFLGGIALEVDGRPVDPGRSLAYRGLMLSDLPNLAVMFGYGAASWTLRADLVAGYVCRLLAHMERTGARWCMPRRDGREMATMPWIDLSSGYLRRGLHRFPSQGAEPPWRIEQDYLRESRLLRLGRIDDGTMAFGGALSPATAR